MRELNALELQAVAGGASAPRPIRQEPPILKIIVAVLERLIKRLEGGGMKQFA
jgi:hypothetical protein